ncbi:MAG: hydantoinase/oxoprolinase family protein [Candidatus Sphingomonas phytovorans]|nr:hydantoinase/oxoprolinase family protein [Sphingomonas sp.]WEK00201.1 MAG: hydantoinase/oxoprolinase family protein [Sphingomonas sp.]
MNLRIGVDVGGTNTDAVILDGKRVRASIKRPTSADVSSGIRVAIADLLAQADLAPDAIDSVMIGTTHFTNAFVQASGLARVAAIRIGFPASRSIPPFASWPARLRDNVRGFAAMIGGGFQFDGRTLGSLDEAGLRSLAREISDAGISEIAVSSVFAQVNAEHEQRAAAILREEIPGASITLSSEVGRIGLIERENAAIMNASLRPLATRVAAAFASALATLGIDAPFFVSQNDGTLMNASLMQRFPVLTFAAGPTNSLRGAYFLTGLGNALVVDIGGTTSDIGVLTDGFPRQSSMQVDIGGIRTNFRTPDILSIGLGGGSRVRALDGHVSIGPDSVGFRLLEEALVFGGRTLTATDVAVAAGYAAIGDRGAVADLDPGLLQSASSEIHRLLADGIDRMKTSAAPVPLILVGGGAALINQPLPGTSETIRPDDAGVANAVGAAIGQVGGEVDRIFHCGEGGRDRALDDARSLAIDAAIDAGAAPDSITIVTLEDLPLQYLPGGARRIVCRAVGDLATIGGHRG